LAILFIWSMQHCDLNATILQVNHAQQVEDNL